MGNAGRVTGSWKDENPCNKVVKSLMKIIERIDDVHMNIKHWQESLENRILVYGVHCFQLDTSDNILPERDEHRKELACMNDDMKENKKVQ